MPQLVVVQPVELHDDARGFTSSEIVFGEPVVAVYESITLELVIGLPPAARSRPPLYSSWICGLSPALVAWRSLGA